MKRIPLVIIILSLVALSGLAGYYFGQNNGYNDGKAVGQQSKEEEINTLTNASKMNYESYVRVSNDYKALSDQYDTLYANATNYIAAPRYTPKTSFSCNTYTYGYSSASTSTYCY